MTVVDLSICFDAQNLPKNDSGASLICVTNFQLVEVEQAKKAQFPCIFFLHNVWNILAYVPLAWLSLESMLYG